MKKHYILLIGIILIIFIGAEIFARYKLGLGSTPIYIESTKFEYIYAPNQDIHRFGNDIKVNEFSMRSFPLKTKEKRILIFGDSVLHGGTLTSHNKLATTLLENDLQSSCDSSIRVLNISAGSWGVDNAFSYLQTNGDFNATMIVLVFSSHDAHDNMNFEKVVGKHPSYPSTQPCCALWDGFNRYLVPKFKSVLNSKSESFSKIHKIDNSKEFNKGWKEFVDYCANHNIKLFILLHPDQAEYLAKEYNINGQKIINFLEDHNVSYMLELYNVQKDNYRDNIHFNEKGQDLIYLELLPVLKRELCYSAKTI